MLLLSCRGIRKSFGDLDVLKGIDFDINEGERTGIVGVNGCGKTTLVGLISGIIGYDEGFVKWGRASVSTGYLLQSSAYLLKNTDGGDYIEYVEPEESEHLSGGERTRSSLRRLLGEGCGLLLLDEPTNHLDFAGVEWLAGELRRYEGTVIVISHDRYFLDMTVNRIIEIDSGIAKSYGGNYTYYRQQKRIEYEEQLHRYAEQKKRKDLLEAEIERVRMWADKSHREAGKKGEGGMGAKEFNRIAALRMDRRVKSKLKRLQRMEETGIARPKEEASMNFAFDNASKHGKRILEAKVMKKGYGGRLLFSDSSFYMLHGDRVGITGPNGCGKTTLLRLVTGEETPDAGDIWLSPTSGAVYISQDVRDMDTEIRPLDLVGSIQGLNPGKARNIFASLGLDAAILARKLGTLSQGERMRVKLAAAILEGSGFLILDEPTNHLDLFSRERLEDALDEYQGTILLVSHDRYLLERVCDKLLVFENGCIKPFYGRFGEYLAPPAAKAPEKKAKYTIEEKLLIENRIAAILGKLSSLSRDDPSYPELEMEFGELSLRKRELGL